MVRAIGQSLTDPDVRLAVLFGSQASGRTHAGSDADVAVALDGDMSSGRRGELSARLSGALGCEVDVVDLRAVQGEFLAQIVLGGEVAVTRDASLLAELAIRALAYREDMRPLVLRVLKDKMRRRLNG
jgi:predicted nucleotidyltransferase